MTERFVVEPVFPNPFNDQAHFCFAVREPQPVRVERFDMLGRRVQVLYDGEPPAGVMQTVRIDGSDLHIGVYVARLATPRGVHFIRALIVLK